MQFNEVLKNEFPRLKTASTETTPDGTKVLLTMDQKEVNNLRKMAVDQGLETIRNRIDQFGVSEPDIRPEEGDRILVQLPGIKNPQEAINLIGKMAVLEFKLVAQNVTEQEIHDNKLPPGVKLYPMRPSDRNAQETKIPLEEKTVLTGQYITDARVEIGGRSFGEAHISLNFDPQGAKIFERLTGENVGRKLAIVLDGVVYSDPVIRERIPGGRAVIEGSFTTKRPRCWRLRCAPAGCPRRSRFLSSARLDRRWAADSIRKGILASAIGGLGIILFMMIYYRFSGVIADMALAMNILLILATDGRYRATLTLPGIAGIALTIGIAVDANVLIYERIREELRLGKTPRAAVDTGYQRATITIMDANVTSAIAALVLYGFGTGPVRGFAVTLFFGLAANMFTAIFVTRIIFDYLLTERRVKELSI